MLLQCISIYLLPLMLDVVAAGLNGLIAQSITRDVCDAIVTDKNDVQSRAVLAHPSHNHFV